MTDDRHESSGSQAWDRLGSFLGHAGEVGQSMSRRNLQLWSDISDNLRGGPYTADKFAADSSRMMLAAMDNVQDAFDLWTRPPDREATAVSVPTVFLFFERVQRGGDTSYTLPDTVYIPVSAAVDSPPDTGEVGLAGADDDTARALAAAIAVTFEKSESRYLVQVSKPAATVSGTYVGVVFVRDGRDQVAIADLRVLIES